MDKHKQRVLIVGGGFAGVKAALELKNDPLFDVALMSTHSRFEYHGAIYRAATGRSPLEVVLPMSEIFAGANNIELILDTASELRPDSYEIEGESGRSYNYDILIMAVGYVVNYFNIPGMADYSESIYNIRQAVQLRHRLVGELRNATPAKPLCVNVIGAGPTGIELASDIRNFAKIVEGKHGLKDINLQVKLIEAGPRVLPLLKPKSSTIAAKRLKEIGVDLQLDTTVTKCTKTKIKTNRGDLKSNITIWTAGNQANPLFKFYPDMFSLDKRGRVEVDRFFQSDRPNVFVIGDAANTPYSGMAQTAIHNAIALGKNLKRAARHQKQAPYAPKKPAYVVPIGANWALLEVDGEIKYGAEGWKARRDADMWVLENFLVYELAKKHHSSGDKLANF